MARRWITESWLSGAVWVALLLLLLGGGCEFWVGIPRVTLEADAGSSTDGGTSCGTHAGPKMVRIDALLGSYCIDTTEVTVNQFNAFVIATGGSLAGAPAACTAPDGGAVMTPLVDNTPADQDLPIGNVGECHAWAYCQWAGKRLCGAIGGGSTIGVADSDTEWTYACINGTQNLDYPYGSSADPQACNIDHPAGAVAVASKPGCKGVTPPFNQIFDMVGNAWEFVNDFGDSGNAVMAHGGSWSTTGAELTGAGGGCHFENGFNGVIFDFEQSGFRCCADLTH